MSTSRQPKGIPAGGQFAAANHSEPAIALTPPAAALPTQREVLEARFYAARTQYEGFAQNEWAESVLAAYPGSPVRPRRHRQGPRRDFRRRYGPV